MILGETMIPSMGVLDEMSATNPWFLFSHYDSCYLASLIEANHFHKLLKMRLQHLSLERIN